MSAESPIKRIKVRHRGNRAMLAKIETMLSKAHFQEIREMYRDDIRNAKEEAGGEWKRRALEAEDLLCESLEREEMACEDCKSCLLATRAARTSMKAAELELKFSKDRWAKEKVEMEQNSKTERLQMELALTKNIVELEREKGEYQVINKKAEGLFRLQQVALQIQESRHQLNLGQLQCALEGTGPPARHPDVVNNTVSPGGKCDTIFFDFFSLSFALHRHLRPSWGDNKSKGDLSSYPFCNQAHQGAPPGVGAKEMQEARRGSAEQAL